MKTYRLTCQQSIYLASWIKEVLGRAKDWIRDIRPNPGLIKPQKSLLTLNLLLYSLILMLNLRIKVRLQFLKFQLHLISNRT